MKTNKPNPSNLHKSSPRFTAARITQLALLTAVALLLYAVESMLPTLVPVPGIKLGLANVVTLIAIRRFGAKEAFLTLLARILLSCFFFGQFLSLLYSLCGGLLCMLVTWGANKLLAGNALPVTSILGAMAHSVAQLCVAYFITSVPGVIVYLPFLMISAILTGLFTGLCAHFTVKNLP